MENNDMLPQTRVTILVVDDTPENLQLLVGILQAQAYKVYAASNGPRALAIARQTPPDVILLDIRMPAMDGLVVCEQLKTDEHTRDIPVIFISAVHETADKVKGFEVGGVDYITKPFQAEEVLARVKMHVLLQRFRHHLEELVTDRTTTLLQEIEHRKQSERELQSAYAEIRQLKDQLYAENLSLREEIRADHNFDEIIGNSEVINYLLFKVRQVAATDATILITGETGVGKELVARAIHQASPRSNHPLIKVNCAALPASMIESELFGHEKGAFTGAAAVRTGRFELADGATIFLDEIGELPLELQPKLLRVLQEGEFERLGSSQTRKVDIRVIAATNRDLNAEIQAGRFRQDLYYRLNVYPLSVLPLREHPEDIPLLVQAFVQKFNKKLGKQIATIPQSTLQTLQQYAWPGNIRELENVIERAMITAQGATLRVEMPEPPAIPVSPAKTLAAVERDYILQVLRAKHWRIEGPHGAALVLGLHPNTLRTRMQKLGIQKPTL